MKYVFILSLFLFGYPIAAQGLFALFRPLRAMTVLWVLGWLFLPMGVVKLPSYGNFEKGESIALAALIAVSLFDSTRISAFRLRLIDLPMLFWCVMPIVTGYTNDLDIGYGLIHSSHQIVDWGVPYLFGRLYFGDTESMREFAKGLVAGAIAYIPCCLYEIKMSPQLHRMVYGFNPHSFGQSVRFGGWRPQVFMQHGLALGLFMCAAAMVAFWLWRRRMLPNLRVIPASVIAVTLVVVAVACKSAGSIVLLAASLLVFLATRLLRTRIVLVLFVLALPLWVTLRTTEVISGAAIVEVVKTVDENRGGSLQSRFRAEKYLLARAYDSPVVGWGGYGRSRVVDVTEEEDFGYYINADSCWVIQIGLYGFLGFGLWYVALALPLLLLLLKIPPGELLDSRNAASVAVSVVCMMFLSDCMFNFMMNPLFVVAAGGLGGIATLPAVGAWPRRRIPARPDRAVTHS